ncbi:MAG: Sec-independent protein translocase subunit TatB [Actinobacteria bacterium]|nr:Sec-independent protein translocase subunit TatB [Actinomycetota bacterium]
MFDLSLTKLMVLAIIAVVIFGPDQLPKVAAQAGRALRELRRMADGARRDLAEGLGPEFQDFDIADLHPRTFVRKHLLDEYEQPDPVVPDPDLQTQATTALAPGETPPYDSEAT